MVFNHPALRYGGYHLFALLIFIPLVLQIEKYQIKWNFYFKRIIILILITITVFVGRNTARLYKEYKIYNYNIFQDTKYKFISGNLDFYLRYNKILDKKILNLDT